MCPVGVKGTFGWCEKHVLVLVGKVAGFFRRPLMETTTDLSSAPEATVRTIEARQAIGLGVLLTLGAAVLYLVLSVGR